MTEQIVVKIRFFPLVYIGARKILVFLVSKSDTRIVNVMTLPILACFSGSFRMFQEFQDPGGLSLLIVWNVSLEIASD